MRAATQDILQTLVAFDTTSRHSNLALIDYVQTYLYGYGIDSQLVHNDSGDKANLYATIGPQDKAGVMLSGHTDVVPVDGQNWSSDPFRLTSKGGRLYARGAADMKGFIACVLAAVPNMISQPLHTPIHLAFSYDEEIGCIGVRTLIDMLAQQPIKPAMAIIGEPTSMQVVIGHKGKCAYEVEVTGCNAHSAYPTEGVNAVIYAAHVIYFIHTLQQQIERNGPFDNDYRVPYTTLNVCTITGGTAANIIPAHCRFDVEIRHLPEQDPQRLLTDILRYIERALLPEMRAIYPGADIRFKEKTQYPGLFTPADGHLVQFVKNLLGDDSHTKVSFGTEGGLFSDRLQVPTVVCGPGSILQAHRADEYVELSQLARCQAMLSALIDQLAE